MLNWPRLFGDLAPTLEHDNTTMKVIKMKYDDHRLHNIVPIALSLKNKNKHYNN